MMESAHNELGDWELAPMNTGSGGLSISKHLDIPVVEEVVSVVTFLKRKYRRSQLPAQMEYQGALKWKDHRNR